MPSQKESENEKLTEKTEKVSEKDKDKEAEIERLRKQLREHEAELVKMRREVEKIIKEKKPEILPEKAAVVFEKERKKLKEILKPSVKEIKIKPAKIPPPPPKIKKEEVEMDLKRVMAMDKPKQVKTLIHLAFSKGLWHSVAVAMRLDDPYILDEFHDTLVDELYDVLVKKGKLKKLE